MNVQLQLFYVPALRLVQDDQLPVVETKERWPDGRKRYVVVLPSGVHVPYIPPNPGGGHAA